MTTPIDDLLGELESVLGRERPLDALTALIDATFGGAREADADAIAVGLDANVVLRLAHKSKTEVVDFLATRHEGPLIIPGQVVQEFWNNTLAVVDTHAEAVRKRYQAFGEEVRKLDLTFEPYAERFRTLIDEFASDYAFAYEPGTAALVKDVLQTLQKKATVTYVPRRRFLDTAAWRSRTRTPPGFRDAGHSDFYVWADYLLGIMLARSGGASFDVAVFVTNDEKPDWSRGGRAHPILVAEVRSLVAVPFETWNLDRLTRYVATRSSELT